MRESPNRPTITIPVKVLRFDGIKTEIKEEEVCSEEVATIILNGEPIVSLAITPEDLVPFAYGHLLCEGWIPSCTAITEVRTEGMNILVTVPDLDPAEKQVGVEIRSSGCPGRRGTWNEIQTIIPDGFKVSSSVIFKAGRKVNELASIWQKTGGTHCSVIMNKSGDVIAVAEDMGRHSSIDKAVGIAFRKGADFHEVVLACSGRMPADMVAKGIRAHIPVIVSHNAPFIHGIELAKQANATLAGFVRPPRMNIYSVPERIYFEINE